MGTVFVLGALRNDDATSDRDGAAQPPAATDAGRVPEAYLGRWSGKAAASGGTIPLGTFEVTLRQAKPGQRVGTVVQHDLIGNTCTDVLTLKSATKEELVATGKGAETNGGQCAQTSHTVRLRPDGRTLGYTSDDPDAGDPRARLTRRK